MHPSPNLRRRALSRARSRLAATALSTLMLCSAGTALAIDTDGDLVDDLIDNCLLEPNGPNELSNQVDTDLDGYGNACDPDFNQDGLVTTGETGTLLTWTLTDGPIPDGPDRVVDLDGDEHGTLNDLMIKWYYQVNQGTPGP